MFYENTCSCIPGMEAIKFQRNSNLASQLIRVYSEVYDYIKEYDKDNDIDTRAKNSKRYTDLTKYFKKKIVPQLISVIEKETNIIVKSITTIAPLDAQGLFAIDINMGNPKEINQLIDIIVGEKSYKHKSKSPKFEEFLDMHKLLDLDNSKLLNNVISKNKKIRADIYFDFGMAYFSHELYPGTESLLPEEMAAIMMHEIGHMLTLVEHSGNMMYLGSYITNNIVEYSKVHDPMELVITHEKKLYEITSDLKKEKVISDSQVKLIDGAISSLKSVSNYVLKESQSFSSRALKKLVSTAFWLIINIIITLAMTYLILKSLIFKYIIYFATHTGRGVSRGGKQAQLYKTGDDIYTDRNRFYFERLADEFVSRHGLGSYAASGLIKIGNFAEKASMVTYNTSPYTSHTVLKIYITIVSYLGKFTSMSGDTLIDEYEQEVDRMKRLLQNNMSIFKDRNLPDSVRKHYLNDTEKLMRIVAKEESKLFPKANKIFWEFLTPIRLGEVLYETMKTGRLSKDMEKMLNQIDDLTNNKLYYQSAKLLDLSK